MHNTNSLQFSLDPCVCQLPGSPPLSNLLKFSLFIALYASKSGFVSLNQYSIECLLRGSGWKWYVPISVCGFHLYMFLSLFIFLFMSMFLSMSTVPFFVWLLYLCLCSYLLLWLSFLSTILYLPMVFVCAPMCIYGSYLHLCSLKFTWFLSVSDSFLYL